MSTTSIESDDGIESLKRAVTRILELSVGVWLERARTLVANDPTTWTAFLDSMGMSPEDATRYERELDGAKAGGELLPWPPMPKNMKLKRHPLQDKLEFIARAVIKAQDDAADRPSVEAWHPTNVAAPEVPPASPAAEPSPAAAESPRVQRVYFIQGLDGGAIKIGVSFDPSERLSTLQTASPVKLRIIGLVAGGPRMERALHARLSAHRLHGEWFTDAPEVMAAIAEVLQ